MSALRILKNTIITTIILGVITLLCVKQYQYAYKTDSIDEVVYIGTLNIDNHYDTVIVSVNGGKLLGLKDFKRVTELAETGEKYKLIYSKRKWHRSFQEIVRFEELDDN